MGTVAGLLLAAGGGRRYGMPKALAAPDGEPLVLQSIRTLQDAGVAPIAVVIGAAADEVRELIVGAGQHDVILVDNPDWESGMGSSLRAGLAALTSIAGSVSLAVDATVVLLVDTPGITSAAVARVAEIAAEGSGVLAAGSYSGTQGHPVLLGRDHWAGVSEQAIEDVGARPYLRDHASDLLLVPCDDIADGRDLDTPYRGRHAAPDGS